MRDIGSKSARVEPEKWGIKNPPKDGLASCIYVSAPKSVYCSFLELMQKGNVDEASLEAIRTLEKIRVVNADEKIKTLEPAGDELRLELIVHANLSEQSVVLQLEKFADGLGGSLLMEKVKVVGGLSFVPAILPRHKVKSLAEFSHLRALRSIPSLRLNRPVLLRSLNVGEVSLPEEPALNQDLKVCVFDGGLGGSSSIAPWVNEYVPSDVKSSHPKLLAHGGEVCSAYLFGPVGDLINPLPAPYTNVDIVRVVSPDDSDPDLFDVLSRIESVIKEGRYKYINLSLGPRLPIDDDEVHVWTSVLDDVLQDGECLATVAVGNDGDLHGELARIQPPGDMVNCLSVGACDTLSENWERSSYSCIGPGRSPGIVKPDGVIFGGSEKEPMQLYSPLSHDIVQTAGTSFAAPYALRVAAGIDAITDMELKPSTIKALMIHHARSNSKPLKHVGWGRMPLSPEEVVECKDDEAIIVYQGDLFPSQHVRIPVPLPEGLNCTWVHIKATFTFASMIDPEHPLHYTKGGLDVTFRANSYKFKQADQEHADTTSFFSDGKLYQGEAELREEAYKWETCLSRQQRFRHSTLVDPVFDVKFQDRERGGAVFRGSDRKSMPYSLVISVRAEGDNTIYNRVLQENQTLKAIGVRSRVSIK